MKQSMLCLAVFFSLATSCAAQDARGPFADVPTDHWAYQDADTLQKAGIVFGDPQTLYHVPSRRPMMRQAFTAAIARLISQMSVPQSPACADVEARLLASPPALAALQELVRRFQPDLTLLHVDTHAVRARLAELSRTALRQLVAKPFPGVPGTHWAASSVETLRRQGLIAGYPQGIFSLPR